MCHLEKYFDCLLCNCHFFCVFFLFHLGATGMRSIIVRVTMLTRLTRLTAVTTVTIVTRGSQILQKCYKKIITFCISNNVKVYRNKNYFQRVKNELLYISFILLDLFGVCMWSTRPVFRKRQFVNRWDATWRWVLADINNLWLTIELY